MNFPKTLDKKPIISKRGKQITDLLVPTVDINNSNVAITDVKMIADFAKMRLDMLVYQIYNDVDKLGMIMKFNGIMNPFAVNTGDIVIFISSLTMMKIAKELSKLEEARNRIRKQFTDKSKTPIASAAFDDFKKRKNLPPQYKQAGHREVQFKNGKMIFGATTVSQKSEETEVAPSRANFYERNNIAKEKTVPNKISY